LKDVCLEIAKRYQIEFLEIGTDINHVHFLVQSVPSYRPTKIITMIKTLTAREVFARVPSVKKQLGGGEFWSDGFYVGTVGQHATEEVLKEYVKIQGQVEGYVQFTYSATQAVLASRYPARLLRGSSFIWNRNFFTPVYSSQFQ